MAASAVPEEGFARLWTLLMRKESTDATAAAAARVLTIMLQEDSAAAARILQHFRQPGAAASALYQQLRWPACGGAAAALVATFAVRSSEMRCWHGAAWLMTWWPAWKGAVQPGWSQLRSARWPRGCQRSCHSCCALEPPGSLPRPQAGAGRSRQWAAAGLLLWRGAAQPSCRSPDLRQPLSLPRAAWLPVTGSVSLTEPHQALICALSALRLPGLTRLPRARCVLVLVPASCLPLQLATAMALSAIARRGRAAQKALRHEAELLPALLRGLERNGRRHQGLHEQRA